MQVFTYLDLSQEENDASSGGIDASVFERRGIPNNVAVFRMNRIPCFAT